MKSLYGATILWTDLVFMFPRMSFVSLDRSATVGLVIESAHPDVRTPGTLIKLDWSPDEWEDYGWEILYPESDSDEQ